jgi:hypothetical protein
MARRIGALVALAALVAGALRVGGVLLGADDTSAAGVVQPTTPPAATEGTVGSADVVSGGSTIPVSNVAPATTVAPADLTPSVPTAADPAVVLIAGDSDAGTFGPYLETILKETGVVKTQLDYKVSSGLSRPDFFDWPAHLQSTIPAVNPDIVVLTFGGNDAQGLTDLSGNFIVQQPTGEGDEEWRAEYGKRVGAVMDFLSSEGRTLVWVGIPNDNNPEVTARMKVQDEVVREQVAAHPGVIFIDTWKRFSGIDGNWAEYVIDPRDGQGKDVRADDGFHLNQAGAEILALDIAEVVRTELVNRGATL